MIRLIFDRVIKATILNRMNKKNYDLINFISETSFAR
jgi:hypothetical protein